LLAACAPIAVTTQVGYARLAVDGDLALADGDADEAPQDLGPAFGLGDEQDAPYGRVAVDFGMPVVSASGLWLREVGNGVLSADFGGLPAGTPVTTDLEFGAFKLMGALELPVGPLVVSPALMVDLIAIDFRASTSPGNREEIDEIVTVPMPALRLDWSPGAAFTVAVEGGFLDARGLADADPRFADLEAMLTWDLGRSGLLFAGYRWLFADAEAVSEAESIRIDVEVGGWYFGGGLRF
jgi:hypothetical protein